MTMSKNKNNQETQKQGAMPEEEKKDMNYSWKNAILFDIQGQKYDKWLETVLEGIEDSECKSKKTVNIQKNILQIWLERT